MIFIDAVAPQRDQAQAIQITINNVTPASRRRRHETTASVTSAPRAPPPRAPPPHVPPPRMPHTQQHSLRSPRLATSRSAPLSQYIYEDTVSDESSVTLSDGESISPARDHRATPIQMSSAPIHARRAPPSLASTSSRRAPAAAQSPFTTTRPVPETHRHSQQRQSHRASTSEDPDQFWMDLGIPYTYRRGTDGEITAVLWERTAPENGGPHLGDQAEAAIHAFGFGHQYRPDLYSAWLRGSTFEQFVRHFGRNSSCQVSILELQFWWDALEATPPNPPIHQENRH